MKLFTTEFRFSETNETSFKCLFCQAKIVEWSKLIETDLSRVNLSEIQSKISKGEVKCCEVVKLVDLDDPEKSILYEQALGFKLQFRENLCFKCKVKINGILVTVGSEVGK